MNKDPNEVIEKIRSVDEKLLHSTREFPPCLRGLLGHLSMNCFPCLRFDIAPVTDIYWSWKGVGVTWAHNFVFVLCFSRRIMPCLCTWKSPQFQKATMHIFTWTNKMWSSWEHSMYTSDCPVFEKLKVGSRWEEAVEIYKGQFQQASSHRT